MTGTKLSAGNDMVRDSDNMFTKVTYPCKD